MAGSGVTSLALPLFNAIRRPADLPTVGTAYEREYLDFKTTYVRSSTYEIAKDVAAFANVLGGVVLVGAEEENDRLKGYVPLTRADADKVMRLANGAVKDRCSPAPPCEIEPIECDGGIVVAINVHAVAGQPVGVKVPKVRGVSEFAFTFPVRVRTGTDYLRPDQLASLMLPEQKHAAICLAAIPEKDRTSIRFEYRVGTSEATNPGTFTGEIDVRTLLAKFDVKNGNQVFALDLPLQAIKVVQPLGGTWRISLRGPLTFHGLIAGWQPL